MRLQEALNRCSRITPKPKKFNTMPVITNVLIEPTEKGICISATDLEMFYQVEVEGVTANNTFTAPLRQLRDIIGKKDVKEITWGTGNMITVGAAKFFGLPKEEFPAFPYSETGINLEEFAEVRLSNLKWVMRAMSTDEIRYTLNGVYVNTKEGKLVATDGHRLHMTNIDKTEAKSVIIPSATVKFLDSIKAGSVYLRAEHGDDPPILYISDDELFISRHIDGDFPDYKQVVPDRKNVNFRLKTTKEALGNAIAQTDGIMTEKNRGVKLTLNGTCRLYAQGGTGEVDLQFDGKFKKLLKPLGNPCGECKNKQEDQEACLIRSCDKLEAFHLSTLDEFNVGVNATYVKDMLAGDDVTWEFINDVGPTMMTFGGDEVAIVMPMRV